MAFMKRPLPLLILLTLFLTGCPVPDVKNFADATALMSTSISNSASQTLDLLAESYKRQKIQEDIFAAADAEKKDYPTEIKSKWKSVDKTLGSMVSYADALTSIVDAGEKGKESFGNVADALGDLASVAGFNPASLAAEVTVDVGKFVYGKIAEIRTAKSLEKVIVAADTTIQIIANHLIDNLDALYRLNFAAETILLTQHLTIEVDRYQNYHKSLLEKELNLIKKITLVNDYENGDPEALISFIYEDPISRDKLGFEDLSKAIEQVLSDDKLSPEQKVTRISDLRKEWDDIIITRLTDETDKNTKTSNFSRYDMNKKVLKKLNIEQRLINMKNELDFNRNEIVKYEAVVQEIEKEEVNIYALGKTNRDLIEKSIEVVKAWKTKHKQMANFFNKKQKISFNDILSYASEINSTYQEFKELQK